MSLGFGLSEELLVDEKTGRPLNNNLLDYKIPTAMDAPDLHVEFIQLDDPTGPYGNKSLGSKKCDLKCYRCSYERKSYDSTETDRKIQGKRSDLGR